MTVHKAELQNPGAARLFRVEGAASDPDAEGSVEVCSRADLTGCTRWAGAFSAERKDSRYYELVEETLHPEFEYRYFVMRDGAGKVSGIQPFFLLDQDLFVGTSSTI